MWKSEHCGAGNKANMEVVGGAELAKATLCQRDTSVARR